MVRLSGRHRAGLLALGIVMFVAGATLGSGNRHSESLLLSTADAVGADAPIGEVVTIHGVITSVTADGYVIEGEDAESLGTVKVVLGRDDDSTTTLGVGVSAVFRGTLVEPGLLKDAALTTRIGPSKYNGADGINTRIWRNS